MPPKFLEDIVILFTERWYSKQNNVIRLKSNILAIPKFLGWLLHWSNTLKLLMSLSLQKHNF